MIRILFAAPTAAVLAAGLFSLAACSGSNPSFQVGNCINWSIGSDGNQVPMKVSCQHPPDPDIDVVRAIAPSDQSCRTGDRFYTEPDGTTLCLEDEYVMSSSG
jgi:hypothetical protein